MPSQEAWLEVQTDAQVWRGIAAAEQKKLRQMVSQAMEKLKMTDPHWKLYAEHIANEIERYKIKQKLIIQDITNHSVFRNAEAYGQLSLENAGTARYIEALEWCLSLIDRLISDGKQEIHE